MPLNQYNSYAHVQRHPATPPPLYQSHSQQQWPPQGAQRPDERVHASYSLDTNNTFASRSPFCSQVDHQRPLDIGTRARTTPPPAFPSPRSGSAASGLPNPPSSPSFALRYRPNESVSQLVPQPFVASSISAPHSDSFMSQGNTQRAAVHSIAPGDFFTYPTGQQQQQQPPPHSAYPPEMAPHGNGQGGHPYTTNNGRNLTGHGNGSNNGQGNGNNGSHYAGSNAGSNVGSAVGSTYANYNAMRTRVNPEPIYPPRHQQTPSAFFDDYVATYRDDHVPDETKSYNSHTHLADRGATPSKEHDIGSVVNSLSYGQPYASNNYPPSPNLHHSYVPPMPQTPAPGQGWFSGSSQWHQVRKNLLSRRVVKQVQLLNGNLVIDVPAARSIVDRTKSAQSGAEPGEMEKLRYTAATCDPDDFTRNKYSLRQYLYGRKTELFIVMTMYNEDATLLLRTLNAVIKNIAHLCSRTRSKTWGLGAWRKVVVCIVADGRNKVDPRVLKVLNLMGVYAEGIAKDTVAGKDVTAHIFEYTTNIVVDDSGEVGSGATPVQVIFCLKERNQKKLNSHRWFFNAFGPQVKPNVCILLDVGTKPTGRSLYELYKCFENHPSVGGACGEIYADLGNFGKYLINPLVAGQNFEYKMSNILDKPFESVFGLISVLPGAFSAYRYAAVANHPNGTGPLASYFHGEMMERPGAKASIFERNKFLAEDRILAFEIVTKKHANWRLQYVKSAKASTDVPSRVPEFISQRRRWLNGSIFASIYAIACFWKIWTSGHGIIRKFLLQLLMVYNLVSFIFSWLSISSFYLAFYFLISSSISNGFDPFYGAGDELFQVINKVYIAILFVVTVCSLGNRPQGSNFMYTLCIFLFACCQGILLYCAGYTVYQTVPHTSAGWTDVKALFSNRTFLDLAMSLMATYGLYLISSLMYLDPWHMFTSFVQYLFLLPSYVNILLIYAFCNLHDVSWGTKGDNGANKDLGSARKIATMDDHLEVALPTKQEDIDAVWQQARKELKIPPQEVKEKRDDATKRSDRDRTFRTNIVLVFMGSNILVILLFTSPLVTGWLTKQFSEASSGNFNPYLTCIFYAVLGLSGLRFIGCTLYLIFRIIGY